MSNAVCQFVFKRSAQLLPAKRLLSTTPRLSTRTLSADDLLQETCPLTRAVAAIEDTFGFNNSNQTISEEQFSDGIKPFSKVPGPKGLPIVGTLFDYFKKDGFRFNKMFEAYQQRAIDYGPIFKENIAAISTVVISDPNEYAKVIQSEGRYPIRKEMEPMAYYRTKRGLGLGLVSSQGEEWHKYRTVLSKKMLKPREVADYCLSMNEVADDFMDRLKSVQDENLEVPNLEKELFKWAMESIGTVLFEERIGCFTNPTPPLAQGFIDNLMGFFKCLQPLMYNVPLYKIYPTKLWKEYENYADNVMSFGKQLVDRKVDAIKAQIEDGLDPFEKEEKSAFLTYLLSQTSLTPEEANSSAVDMMTGAVETTSNGTVWALYCLAQNSEAQEKIFEEVSKCLAIGEQITPKTLTNIPYIKACLKETFRIYPITFATSRYLQEDTEIAGYSIPAGTHVQGNTFGMGRDPNLFPQPEKFIPERWMRGNNDNNLRAFSNLVWGHGARMCIGRRFAEQEIYIALAKIVQNFKLEYRHEPLQPVLNTIMTPDRPARIAFIPRNMTSAL